MKGVGVLISLIQNKTSQSNLSRIAEIGDLNFSQMWVFIIRQQLKPPSGIRAPCL